VLPGTTHGSLTCLFSLSATFYYHIFFLYATTKGTGKVSGKVVTDTVSIAGLTVAGQTFGAVNNQSGEFGRQPNDGLIGMAFGTIAQCRQPTFFENLIKARALPAPLFSIHLSRHKEIGSSVCLVSRLT
jgi:Eukaryotic aspartyl protease